MTKIGDYVHLHGERYRKFGTLIGTKEGKKGYSTEFGYNSNNENNKYSTSATEAYKKQKTYILTNFKGSSVSNNSLEKLSLYLTALAYGDWDAAGVSEAVFQKFWSLLEKEITDRYHNIGVVTSNTRNNMDYGLQIFNKGKTINNTQHIGRTRLESYIKILQNLEKRISLDDNARLKKGYSQTSALMLLEKTIDEIQSFLNQNSEQQFSITQNTKNVNDLIKNINTAIMVESLPDNSARGDLGELFLVYANALLEGQIDENTEKLLDDSFKKAHWVGEKKSKVEIDWTKFDPTINKYLKLTPESSINFSSNETKDKLDVIFSWENEKLRISMKNYQLKDNSASIHLVQGTSLLYLIQNENPDFVNHWLNLLATSEESTRSQNKIKNTFDRIMKLTIFAKALTGQNLGRSGWADTFIINWRTKKKIYVFSMKDIIQAVDYNQQIAKISNYPKNLPNKKIVPPENGSYDAAKKRIAFMLKDVHSYKLDVYLYAKGLIMSEIVAFK